MNQTAAAQVPVNWLHSSKAPRMNFVKVFMYLLKILPVNMPFYIVAVSESY